MNKFYAQWSHWQGRGPGPGDARRSDARLATAQAIGALMCCACSECSFSVQAAHTRSVTGGSLGSVSSPLSSYPTLRKALPTSSRACARANHAAFPIARNTTPAADRSGQHRTYPDTSVSGRTTIPHTRPRIGLAARFSQTPSGLPRWPDWLCSLRTGRASHCR